MEDELLAKLIAFVEQASPQLWAIAQRQVYVNTIRYILWSIVAVVGGIFFTCLAHNRWEAYEEDRKEGKWSTDNDVWAVVSAIVAIVSAICALWLWDSLIGLILNPQYYAISTLLNLVK